MAGISGSASSGGVSATKTQGGLTVTGLSKSFGKTRANDDISVRLIPGEVTALIGHNGAGKTTFLNQIVGLTKPDAGSINYGSTDLIAHPTQARQICAIMPQVTSSLEGVTPRQAIATAVRIRGLKSKQAQRAVQETLDTLDLGDWADRPGHKLSGGIKRLTSFGMAVTAPAPIYLFDEPTNDVDPVRRELLWRMLRMRAEQGATVLIVTHNLLEVERHADRYLLFNKGLLVRDEPTSALGLAEAKSTLSITATPEFLQELRSVLDVKTSSSLGNMPDTEYIEKRIEDDSSIPREFTVTLSTDALELALPHVLSGIRAGCVESYRIGSASLVDNYEEMINHD